MDGGILSLGKSLRLDGFQNFSFLNRDGKFLWPMERQLVGSNGMIQAGTQPIQSVSSSAALQPMRRKIGEVLFLRNGSGYSVMRSSMIMTYLSHREEAFGKFLAGRNPSQW